jgi:uncharacterized membrane protein
MKDIPLDVPVRCTDGKCGRSVRVIVDRETRKATHLVVQDGTAPEPNQRLVPLDQVVETSEHWINLSCTKGELARMAPFVHKRTIEKAGHDYSMWQGGQGAGSASEAAATYVIVEEEQIAKGELAIGRGTRVRASDGDIGRVDALLATPGGEVTHFVLEEGNLLGKKEVTLPLSAVDRVDETGVYLKLSKAAIERLPSVPFKRRHPREWEEEHVELVTRIFDDPNRANDALKFVEDLRRRKILKIRNAAVLVKDEDGQVKVRDTRDLEPKKGRLIGAIAGGLVGLLGGPVGVVVGALAGLGAGSLAAKWVDLGFSDKFLKEFQENLGPGCSALVLVVENEFVTPMSEALADWQGVVLQQTLTDEMVQDLLAET